MSRMKALALSLLAAFAISAVAAGAAQATEPQFHYGGSALTETLPFKSTSGVGHLYIPGLGISIECEKDQNVGFFEPNGKTKVIVVFEGCKVVGLSNCTVENIEVFAKDQLYYEVGSEKGTPVDVFKPAPGSTVFTEVTLKGKGCGLLGGTYQITGSVIGTLSPVNEEAKVGEVKFTTEGESHETQTPSEYEKPNEEIVTGVGLKFGTYAATFETTDEVELLNGEKIGAFSS
jgi:hypothetical protein